MLLPVEFHFIVLFTGAKALDATGESRFIALILRNLEEGMENEYFLFTSSTRL